MLSSDEKLILIVWPDFLPICDYLHFYFTLPLISCVDATVSFNQSIYNVDEDSEQAQPVILLSNPSSTDITVQVTDNSTTATGM